MSGIRLYAPQKSLRIRLPLATCRIMRGRRVTAFLLSTNSRKPSPLSSQYPPNTQRWATNLPLKKVDKLFYRVTHHVGPNLPLTPKQRLRFSTWASYYTKTELLLWCQPEIWTNMMCHLVVSCYTPLNFHVQLSVYLLYFLRATTDSSISTTRRLPPTMPPICLGLSRNHLLQTSRKICETQRRVYQRIFHLL